ncbi:MAG: cupredoxin domain-containing protein [Nanoarchaeota archaeon]|nr:cupredoxin domain-containing protein [Nanoarchaeota archaeon]
MSLDNEKKIVILVLIVASVGLLMCLENTGLVIKQQPREITIFAEKWEFVPNVIKVKYNEPIKLKLVTSEKNESFGFKLSRYMYNDLIIIEPNVTKTFDFKAQTKGIFIYRCESPCGWGKNLMVGRLIVE